MVKKKNRKQKNHQIARKTVGKERGGEVAKSAHCLPWEYSPTDGANG